MCRYKVILLMGLLGLVAASPAMALDYFNVGVNFGHGYRYAPPVVVHERVYAPPVVIEKPCYSVMVPRSHVEFTYVSPHHYRASHYFDRPHGARVIVRARH